MPLVGHQLHLSMFGEMYECYLQHWGLVVKLWEVTDGVGNNSLWYLGIPMSYVVS